MYFNIHLYKGLMKICKSVTDRKFGLGDESICNINVLNVYGGIFGMGCAVVDNNITDFFILFSTTDRVTINGRCILALREDIERCRIVMGEIVNNSWRTRKTYKSKPHKDLDTNRQFTTEVLL